MDIEALKAKLGDETFGQLQTYISDLTGQRDAARNESIQGRKTMKAKVAELEGVQAKVFERLGIDAVEELDALPDAKGQAEAMKQVEAKLKRLEREAADKGKAFDELSAKHRSVIQQSTLQKALSAHQFIDADLVASYLNQRVVWEDDQPLYRADDNKLLPLDEGVKLLATTKPHLLKAQGVGGSGYTGARGNGQAGTQIMNRADFDSLTPKAQMDFVKAGGQLQ